MDETEQSCGGLEFKSVSVNFGGVKALQDVSFSVGQGELHGLIGPNGAGKTTALNAISRLVPLSSGELRWNDASLDCAPQELVRLGIARGFQTPAIFESMSAVENVMVGGHTLGRRGVLASMLGLQRAREEDKQLRLKARETLESLRFPGDLNEYAERMTLPDRRIIDVARALMCDPALLLLDEPTAGLSPKEAEEFGSMLRLLNLERKISIVLIEHNVSFVFGLCVTVTALDNGSVVASGPAAEVQSHEGVVESYIGKESESLRSPHSVDSDAEVGSLPTVHVQAVQDAAQSRSPSDAVEGAGLVIRGLTSGYGDLRVLHGIDMQIDPGGITTIFGRNGAGKSTLMGTIMGSPKANSGTVHWGGKELGRSIVRSIRAGASLVPQDRSVVAEQTVTENLALSLFGLAVGRREAIEREANMYDLFPRLKERRKQLAGTLSGGERQMLAIAKAVIREPTLLLLDEPSIGLAPRIVDEMAELVSKLASSGLTVVIVEQNARWVLPISKRTLLLDSGKVMSPATGDRESIDQLALGYFGLSQTSDS